MNNRDITTYSEKELKEIALKVGDEITYRRTEYDDEYTRKSTGYEENIIYSVAYGALLAIRSNGAYPEMVNPILYTAESILDAFLPTCNGYMTVFTKLDKLLIENRAENRIEIREDYL